MKKYLKIVLIFIAAVAVLLGAVLGFFLVGKQKISENITWGVDFSQSQAEYLKLDWKDVYLKTITDLGVKNIKLHTNWDLIETNNGGYYFADTDWQIKKAEENNVKILYVLGLKTGRWPECHVPSWASDFSEQQLKEATLSYIKNVVQRYKNSEAIAYWQVENEPLFNFGICPAWYYKSDEFLQQEVALIKLLDPSRKIIVSDSGEGSAWLKAGKIGDIVGVTIYRKVWTHITDNFGFNTTYLFINPTVYARKAFIVEKMFGKKVIGIELQAEPWSYKPLMETSLPEQSKTMSPEIFNQNVEFAKKTGFDTFYFWGVEWWYWLKETQNQPEIWNQAKTLFKQ